MKRTRILLIGGFLAVYFLGMLSGGTLTKVVAQRQLWRLQSTHPEVFFARTRMGVLDNLLKLDREQKRRIELILVQRYQAAQPLRQRIEPESLEQWEIAVAQIRSVLYDQQLLHFDEFVRSSREQRRRRFGGAETP